MRKRGFTIIEFIVAISIGIILVSVGIPRFNGFIQKQQFIGQVNELAGCLQKVQRFAVAPPQANAQFFSADLTSVNTSSDNLVLCTPQAFYLVGTVFTPVPGYATDKSQATGLTLVSDTITGAQPGSPTTVTVSTPAKLQIIYSVLHSGYPVQVQNDGAVSFSTINTNPQAGFTQKLDLKSVDNTNWHAYITIDRPGSPVTVTYTLP